MYMQAGSQTSMFISLISKVIVKSVFLSTFSQLLLLACMLPGNILTHNKHIMARKDFPEVRCDETTRVVHNLQEKSNFYHFIDDDSNDVILIMKDNENQSVTMKKVRRCNVCRQIPETNCICKQKSGSLQSNISEVSKKSNVSYTKDREKVN